MRYRFCLLLGALLTGAAAGPAAAQKLVRRFAGSAVLLTNGDTLRGPLTLYSEQDVLVLRQADGTLRTFAPWAVRAFAVKGELTDYDHLLPPPTTPASASLERMERLLTEMVDTTIVRVFISYRSRPRAGQRPSEAILPGFYELLCDGSVSLLRRESLRVQARPEYQVRRGRNGKMMLTQAYLIDHFFLFTADGQLTPLRRPRRDLAAALPQQAPELERYAQLNRLDYANAYQLRAIVRYANNLLATAR